METLQKSSICLFNLFIQIRLDSLDLVGLHSEIFIVMILQQDLHGGIVPTRILLQDPAKIIRKTRTSRVNQNWRAPLIELANTRAYCFSRSAMLLDLHGKSCSPHLQSTLDSTQVVDHKKTFFNFFRFPNRKALGAGRVPNGESPEI